MTLALYTLADEKYVPGVASLINSVRKIGFSGPIHVGSPDRLSISADACDDIIFHTLSRSSYWLGNRKAEFVLAHPSERFAFLDADMIVTDGRFLQRMERWLEGAPVFGVEALVAPVDYRRHMWAERLGRAANPDKWPMHYFNSGLFAGIFQRDRALLEAWDSAIRFLLKPPADILSDSDFPMPDQDSLNAVLQDWNPQPIGIGPPDVWMAASQFNPFLHIGTFGQPAVLHCTGTPKPWQITQYPSRYPNVYDRAWYQHAVVSPGPVRIEAVIPPALRGWFEQRPSVARILFRLSSKCRRLLGA
jgi:hypothetical protein